MHKFFWVCLLFCIIGVGVALAQSDEVITSGEEIEADLTDDMLEMRYTFTAVAGERVTITASSRQFDTLLQLEDESGTAIASNDDSDGSLNSRIDSFELTDEGDYIIIVTSSDGTETGEFTLSLSSTTATPITYGDTIQGTVDADAGRMIYQFEATEGDVISLRMNSNAFDSYLILSNQDGELMTDDDSAGNLNAMIASYVIPETDIYFITATSFSNSSAGDFTLSLAEVTSVNIEYNTPTEATIEDSSLYFIFSAQSGDTINIRVRSDGGLLDTSLNLLNTFGYSIGNDDDGGYVYDPELNNIILNSDGDYIVIVAPADETVSGAFTIEIVQEPPKIIECDASDTITFTQKRLSSSYQIEFGTAESISFDVYGEESQLNSLSFIFKHNDEDIYPEFDWNTDGQFTVSISVDSFDELGLLINTFIADNQSFEMDVTCS